MSTYRAPVRDMQFVLRELADVEEIAKLPGCEVTLDVLDSILEEAAAFAAGVLDPLNRIADKEGCTFADGTVTTPKGFKEAYKKFADAGWIGLPVPDEYGGQGLPQVLLGPTLEMWNAANIGFANGPLLNQGAIEAIELKGSDEQKRRFIPNLVSGKWTGTMCLTEPQAGSDIAQVRTKAVPDGEHYRLTGQKIFITFGEHDMAENIVHLVLARLPDAPEGTKGISLFIVPKFVVKAGGALGDANEVVCTGIEHKLGINGNPTCTMSIGEGGKGAIGYLVGEANRGLEYMFVMMNAARFSVGVQGIALADRAYQSALAYAKERVQGRDIKPGSKAPEAIVKHPDVRRMLMWQKATIEGMRALSYVTAASLDFSQRHPDEKVRKEHRAFVELMIPVVKGWCTESAIEVCSTALQVFGGMGYIEETGIAQQYRDVRIVTIYEGTTGIQSVDLIGRKLIRDMGAAATRHRKEDGTRCQGVCGERKCRCQSRRHGVERGAGDSRRRLAMDRHERDVGSAQSLRVQRSVSQALGRRGRRMADGARRASRGLQRLPRATAKAEFYRAKLATGEVLRNPRAFAESLVRASDQRGIGRRDGRHRGAIRSRSQDGRAGISVSEIHVRSVDAGEEGGTVRVITLDNPPVNALSFAYSAQLLAAIEDAEADRCGESGRSHRSQRPFQRRRRRQRFQCRDAARCKNDSRRNRGSRARNKALRRRDRRQRARRRPRALAGMRLPRGDHQAAIEGRPAGDQTRFASRRRRHAASPARNRRASGARVHPQRQETLCRGGGGTRHTRRCRRRRRRGRGDRMDDARAAATPPFRARRLHRQGHSRAGRAVRGFASA